MTIEKLLEKWDAEAKEGAPNVAGYRRGKGSAAAELREYLAAAALAPAAEAVAWRYRYDDSINWCYRDDRPPVPAPNKTIQPIYTAPQPATVVDAVPAKALRDLVHAYVKLLESGRDRITSLGGDCDTVDVMIRGDIDLCKAQAALAPKPASDAGEGSDQTIGELHAAGFRVTVEPDDGECPTTELIAELTDRITDLEELNKVLAGNVSCCEQTIAHLESQLEKVRGLAERLSWLTPVAEELTAILQPASDDAGSA